MMEGQDQVVMFLEYLLEYSEYTNSYLDFVTSCGFFWEQRKNLLYKKIIKKPGYFGK